MLLRIQRRSLKKKIKRPYLRIFAGRIGAELERMKAEEALEKKNDELNRRLNEIELYNSTVKNLRDQIFWIDKQGNFIRVNEAVSRETGYTSRRININECIPFKSFTDEGRMEQKMGRDKDQRTRKFWKLNTKTKMAVSMPLKSPIILLNMKEKNISAVLYVISGKENWKKNYCEPYQKALLH